MQAILNATDDSWTGCRDHLLFLFLYNTGARVSEAISVRVQDVQRHDYRAVQLLGKGRKQRMVPLWKETTRLIRAWLKIAGLKSESNRCCLTASAYEMTRTAVQQRLRLLVQAAEPKCPSLHHRRISPHTIRHPRQCIYSNPGLPPLSLPSGSAMRTRRRHTNTSKPTLQMKEAALRHLHSPKNKPRRFKPRASLLQFLDNL